jgi:SAM-dependent methyltransferase
MSSPTRVTSSSIRVSRAERLQYRGAVRPAIHHFECALADRVVVLQHWRVALRLRDIKDRLDHVAWMPRHLPTMAQYVLQRWGAEEIERERLALLERYHDPLTRRQLDAIGVSDGWRCVDVGAGGGSVTRLLAERVGERGSVLATDLDPRLLEPLAGGRVSVLRHDLLKEPLPQAAFDLAHARLLLMHLPCRLEGLRRIAASIRPGGWLAVLDVDFTSVRLTPSSGTWERAWSAFLDAIVASGWDPSYGARLYNDLHALGLEAVDAEFVRSCGPGGSVAARLLGLTLERLRARMLADGASEQDVDGARRLLEDPAVRFQSQTTVLASGRRHE